MSWLFNNQPFKLIKLSQKRFPIKQALLTWGIFFCTIDKCNALPDDETQRDTLVTSTQQQAIAFIDSIKEIKSSSFWPNINPVLFLQNLKLNIHQPISIYPGNSTNFCGHGALTYLFLLDDPLGYARLLIQLYREGKASFGDVNFNPSMAVKEAAGTLRYKGILDIHPAEQMWFLSLADHFKGWLNFFNRKYDPGDENTFWASVNYSKFNRMVKKLLGYQVKARGGDILHPRVGNLYEDIAEKINTGTVVLFINNRIVHKKNHISLKLGIPTHFIVAEKISRENNSITLVYWDYGGKTLVQVSPVLLKRLIFGITYCTKKTNDAE